MMAKGKQAQSPEISRFRLWEIAYRDQFICWLCEQPVDMRLSRHHPAGATMDHVLPRSDSGDTSKGNLRLAHAFCNSRRHDVDVAFFPEQDQRYLRRLAQWQSRPKTIPGSYGGFAIPAGAGTPAEHHQHSHCTSFDEAVQVANERLADDARRYGGTKARYRYWIYRRPSGGAWVVQPVKNDGKRKHFSHRQANAPDNSWPRYFASFQEARAFVAAELKAGPRKGRWYSYEITKGTSEKALASGRPWRVQRARMAANGVRRPTPASAPALAQVVDMGSAKAALARRFGTR